MPRIRSVHPCLWTNETFVELSIATRLLWIGCWTEADDYGLLELRSKKLKMRLFPADDVDVEALLTELKEAGLLIPIERNGWQLAVIRNFRKWQRPKKPSPPLVPIDDEIKRLIRLADRPDAGEEVANYFPTTGEPVLQKVGTSPADGGDKMEEDNTGSTDPAVPVAPEQASGGPEASAFAPTPSKGREELCREGLAIVVAATGKPSAAARSLIGKWLRDARDDAHGVLAVLRRARDEQAADIVPFVTATIQARYSPSRKGATSSEPRPPAPGLSKPCWSPGDR